MPREVAGMETRLWDLRNKEVISVTDGSRFGYVGDLTVELDSGRVCEIIIPGQARFFGLFGRGEDAVFPWESIRRFGEDIILVEGEPELRRPFRERRRWF